MCQKFQIKRKQRKKFKNWLLYDTTIDPFLLSAKLSEETIQEIEDWLKEKQKKLIKQENGSRV